MRYDKPIYFVKESGKYYDPDFGEWQIDEPVKTKRRANITHMSAERQLAVFGDVRSDRAIVRLQRPFIEPYDFIEINGKAHTVDTERCPSNKQSLVVIANVGN